MSKEIAQTVGGKRIAWLIAIVAAFAVFATVGSQFRSASANTTVSDFVVYGPYETEADAIGNDPTDVINTAEYGDTVYYNVGGTLSAGYATPLDVTFLPASGMTVTGNQPSAGPTPVDCVPASDACVRYTAPNEGMVFAVVFAATVTSDVDAEIEGINVTVNDASVQPAETLPACVPPNGLDEYGNCTEALDVEGSALNIEKDMSPATVSGGGIVTIVLTLTNPAPGADAAATSVVVSDLLPSTFNRILAVTPQAPYTCSAPASTPTTNLQVTCNAVSHPVDATATITIIAELDAELTSGAVISNTATTTTTNGPADSSTDSVTVAAAALTALPEGLHHLDPFGVPLALSEYGEACRLTATGTYSPTAALSDRDDCNNVIGFVHEVCLVQGVDSEGIDIDGIIPPATADGDEDDYFWRIDNVIGGGQATVNGQSTFINTDFNGLFLNGDDLECVRWYSTAPGEQNVTIVNGAGEIVANWHGSVDPWDDGDVVDAYEPLVKEWNVLVPTAITARGALSPNLDGTTITRATTFNSATGTYDSPLAVQLDEHVFGTHQSVGGTVGPVWVDGARVTFTVTGSCGVITVDPLGDTTLEGGPFVRNYSTVAPGNSVTVTSVGVPINFDVNTYECSSLDGSGTTVTISADYPTNIGSISPAPPADEVISINWVSTVPVKDVILAWAGQRIIVEHDWRIAPGDSDDTSSTTNNVYDPNGVCAFTTGNGPSTFNVIGVRGSGPGNFLSGLGVSTSNLRDTANVNVSTDNDQSGDAPGTPQGACISRFLYESEDPGQVDLEFFIQDAPATKIAVVIYYMKIEAVNTSLVTSVEKPNHNGTGSDFAPGNPWNTENDVMATEWNVSKDLLVRVSVKGWFVNANPSGRERDASDPFNVLPQDRWVMPDDWAVLIAGGAGIDFRPEYDYMFAPNSGVSLTSPEGALVQLGATVTAASTGTTIAVSAATPFTVGQTVNIGTSCASTVTRTITAVDTVNNRITVTGSPVAAITVAEGNVVCFPTTVPFEGPHSLIDIQGRAPLFGGAALSNFDPDNIRDTRLGDNRLDWWDAPMPSTPITVDIRGAGFIKQVLKSDVYYIGTANSTAQVYPNPYYITNIPESPYISSSAGGGSFLWNSWGNDGPGGNGQGVYRFWNPVRIGVNIAGNPGETLTAAQQNELTQIRAVYADPTIARRLVVFSDNHGEAMVIANGDFNLDYADCPVNALAGGRHCNQGDVVGSSDIYATADYPDFRGKHFPVRGPVAEVDWTWGGYKAVTIEEGEVEQFVYVVFRALDRDGFCIPPTGAVSLHPVHTPTDLAVAAVADAAYDFPNASGVGPTAQIELIDFMIDSDEGGIFIETSGGRSPIGVTREFADGVPTYSTADANRSLTAQNDLRKFDPINDSVSECQAWVKISNSLLGVTNVLVIAANDEGNVGFDVIVDFDSEIDYTLNFRWSLITWAGADNISPMDALSGTGANDGGTDILDQVTAVYGWEATSQSWLAFFPDGVDVPGANDLTGLRTGHAYWIAIRGPQSITWTVVTNVN